MPTLPPPYVFGLPYRRWRQNQARAIERVLDASTRFVVVEAPTGSGKTALALAVAQLDQGPAAILTATRGLQDQYCQVGSELAVDIRGARNYPCLAAEDEFRDLFPRKRPVSCDHGPCLVGEECERRKHGCLYYDARSQATIASVALTNYAYWIAAHRFAEGLGTRRLLILDEAHAAPEELAGQLEVEVKASALDAALPESTEIDGWVSWAQQQVPRIRSRIGQSRTVRERLHWQRQLTLVEQIIRLDPLGWVVEHHRHDRATLAPILVEPYAEFCLFQGVPKVVMLSATITPATLERLAVRGEDATWVRLPSTFPAKQRPILVLTDAGRVDFRMKPEAEAHWLSLIVQLVRDRLDRKGLIHSVSYARANQIAEALMCLAPRGLRLARPPSASHLPRALEAFRAAGPGVVLISPSIVSGFDFPYEDAEYQILAKVPFPDGRSPIAKARFKANDRLRFGLTLDAMLQACGRIVRAADDQGETFIVDAHAAWFLKKHLRVLPRWIVPALKLTSTVPHPLPMLRRSA